MTTKLSETATDLEFRKPNESIGLRIKEGKFSLLSRKLYNVLVYHAQKMKVTGQNAPIDTAAAKKYFWIPLADVARSSVYDSNDTEFLKQHIEELQNIKIHMEDDKQWTSERLISSVKLVNPAGLKKKGGMIWIGFAFPPEVFEMVMNPNTYTKLSIYYQGFLRSGASLALYEICRRYATNPSKVTCIESYEYWYGALTGTPVREDPPPYKYFKRDMLKPNISEINASTDIEVELIEHKNGKKVIALQFHVELKRQPDLEFPPSPVINGELITKLMKYGLSQSEASNLTAQHSEEKLLGAIHLTSTRMNARNSPALDAPVAYFRWALKQKTPAPLKAAPALPNAAAKGEERSLMERFINARARYAIEQFNALNEVEQADLLELFMQSPDSKGVKLKKGIKGALAQKAIGLWYAQHQCGDPTEEALAAFVGAD